MMNSLFWSFVSCYFLFHSIVGDQLCIDRCDFQYDFDSNFTLPSNCNLTRRDRCYVLMIFEYNKNLIEVHFSLEPDDEIDAGENQTDLVVRSMISLVEPSVLQHSVGYFCATGDQCDLEFVRQTILPTFLEKSCERFRAKLIDYLNPNPPSVSRQCYENENTTLKCDAACQLIYTGPNEISRSCDDDLGMRFETIVGQSTPIDKPEYDYRNYSYACNTPLCNGRLMQERIENLIVYDHGECLISFKEMNETTTTVIPSKSTSRYVSDLCMILFVVSFLF